MIVGREALFKFTGFGAERYKTATKLYNFPKPKGRLGVAKWGRRAQCWDPAEVEAWLKTTNMRVEKLQQKGFY